MKIVEITDSAVALDSGANKSINEVIWNYRSECCRSPLDLANGILLCAWCGKSDGLKIVHKAAIVSDGIQIIDAIDALPDSVRDRAATGYYKALDDPSIKMVHVFDVGGAYEQFDLPYEMRK